MSPAETGSHAVGPADVEGWFSELGLTPSERADREGIASWDLVLDGRRRFDLRVTVILDPTLAVICWAHYAPPISDMFRKSYRKLLRWNDEFPFAKFSVGEDERPLLAVELPIESAAADALGLAVDWDAVGRLDDEMLVNAIAQVAPFDAGAKQALLEEATLAGRADLVVQLMQFQRLAPGGADMSQTVQ